MNSDKIGEYLSILIDEYEKLDFKRIPPIGGHVISLKRQVGRMNYMTISYFQNTLIPGNYLADIQIFVYLSLEMKLYGLEKASFNDYLLFEFHERGLCTKGLHRNIKGWSYENKTDSVASINKDFVPFLNDVCDEQKLISYLERGRPAEPVNSSSKKAKFKPILRRLTNSILGETRDADTIVYESPPLYDMLLANLTYAENDKIKCKKYCARYNAYLETLTVQNRNPYENYPH